MNPTLNKSNYLRSEHHSSFTTRSKNSTGVKPEASVERDHLLKFTPSVKAPRSFGLVPDGCRRLAAGTAVKFYRGGSLFPPSAV